MVSAAFTVVWPVFGSAAIGISPSHHRLHPVLVRIFLRLGLSKTLKEERVFSPGERVDHVVLATRGVTARAIGSTKGDSPAIALSTPGHLAAGNLNFFS